MQRIAHAAAFLVSLTALGCGDLVVPGTDGGGSSDDGGDVGCAIECGEDATCAADATCVCDTGYEGDGQSCTDINECDVNNGDCDVNATCVNDVGSSFCFCDANFAGDGTTCTEVWNLAGQLPGANVNPDNFGTIAVGHGSEVFFAPRTNTTANLFFRSFDLISGSFSDPLPLPPTLPGDFCACGLGESLASDGQDLYLLGNNGNRYSPQDRRWLGFPTYGPESERGEAAVTHDTASDSLLIFGGRDNVFGALRLGLGDGNVQDEPGVPPIALQNHVAFTIPNIGVSFIAVPGDGASPTQLLSHLTATKQWQTHSPAPAALSRPIGIGVLGDNRVWVADSSDTIFFYDPMLDSWATTTVLAPSDAEVIMQVQQDIVAITQAGPNTQIWRLVNLP